MLNEQQMLADFYALSPEKQAEVADFIAFVKSRSERPMRHTPAQKERLLTLLAQVQQEQVFRMIPDALRWQEDQRDAWT